jgi:hypothetical protein
MSMETDKRTTYLAVILGFHEVIGILLGKTVARLRLALPQVPTYPRIKDICNAAGVIITYY